MRWLAFIFAWHGNVLGVLISLQTLREALQVWGYPAVVLFVMIESSGIPFPGETMLLLASFLAAVDGHLQIPLVIACAALGAIVGDNIGYLIGNKGGRPLVRRYGRYVFLKMEHLEKAERFFEKHGDKTVFFGRFIAVLRAWAAFLAGVNHMHWRRFLVYNAAGGILWATIFGLLGFYAGRLFHDNFDAVERIARTISWTGAILLVALVLVVFIIYRVRRARRERAEAAARHASEERSQPGEGAQESAGVSELPAPGTAVKAASQDEETSHMVENREEGGAVSPTGSGERDGRSGDGRPAEEARSGPLPGREA